MSLDYRAELLKAQKELKETKLQLDALKRVTQLLPCKPFTVNQVEIQKDVVRSENYKLETSPYQGCKDNYVLQCEVLSDMKKLNMAADERRAKGLAVGAKTNFCL